MEESFCCKKHLILYVKEIEKAKGNMEKAINALKKDSSLEEGTYPLKRSSVFNLPIKCNKC